MRVAGVVMIDRDPVELRPEVSFHLLHQMAGGLARVGQLHPFLGRNDEAELMAVLAAPVEESAAILHIALARIDLAFLTILRHAIPFEIAQVRVHRLGADILPSAGSSALRVELHHARLHRHPSRPRARPAPIPAPGAPIPEAQRRCSAAAPRVESAASLPGAGVPVRIAASAPDRPMDLTKEAGRAPTRRADPTCVCLCIATVADLAGADAEVVFIACHETTIGSRKA